MGGGRTLLILADQAALYQLGSADPPPIFKTFLTAPSMTRRRSFVPIIRNKGAPPKQVCMCKKLHLPIFAVHLLVVTMEKC